MCVRIEAAVFRKLSLIVLDAFAESTFRKSFDDKRQCHSVLTPFLFRVTRKLKGVIESHSFARYFMCHTTLRTAVSFVGFFEEHGA